MEGETKKTGFEDGAYGTVLGWSYTGESRLTGQGLGLAFTLLVSRWHT